LAFIDVLLWVFDVKRLISVKIDLIRIVMIVMIMGYYQQVTLGSIALYIIPGLIHPLQLQSMGRQPKPPRSEGDSRIN